MRFYQIQGSLISVSYEEFKDKTYPYAAVLTQDEWKKNSSIFDMGIDMEIPTVDQRETKAVVNYDSLTGCFSIPDRDNIMERHFFAFALDEKGIVFIDDTGYVLKLIEKIQRTKKWRMPSLERFLYDVLEEIISKDLSLLEKFEHKLNHTEEQVLKEEGEEFPTELNQIRGDLIDLKVHYEQLIDLGQELEENENGFFKQENLRFFRLFTERVIRLQDTTASLKDYIVQLRDLVQSEMEVRQNKIMTLLTVITSIFLPLTLVAGWYGMNFRYMPELNWRIGYPLIFVFCILIVIGCIIWFKKKKWM